MAFSLALFITARHPLQKRFSVSHLIEAGISFLVFSLIIASIGIGYGNYLELKTLGNKQGGITLGIVLSGSLIAAILGFYPFLYHYALKPKNESNNKKGDKYHADAID